MLRKAKGQAVESIVIPKGGSRGNAGALVDGLNVKNSRAQGPCAIVRCLQGGNVVEYGIGSKDMIQGEGSI